MVLSNILIEISGRIADFATLAYQPYKVYGTSLKSQSARQRSSRRIFKKILSRKLMDLVTAFKSIILY